MKWKSFSCVWLFATPRTIVHGILQARILEWVAFPFSRGASHPRDWTQVSCIAGGFFTSWATRKPHPNISPPHHPSPVNSALIWLLLFPQLPVPRSSFLLAFLCFPPRLLLILVSSPVCCFSLWPNDPSSQPCSAPLWGLVSCPVVLSPQSPWLPHIFMDFCLFLPPPLLSAVCTLFLLHLPHPHPLPLPAPQLTLLSPCFFLLLPLLSPIVPSFCTSSKLLCLPTLLPFSPTLGKVLLLLITGLLPCFPHLPGESPHLNLTLNNLGLLFSPCYFLSLFFHSVKQNKENFENVESGGFQGKASVTTTGVQLQGLSLVVQ